MDIATIVGMVLGIIIVAIAIVMGGSASMFVNIPSILIVFGGAIAATVLRFPLAEVMNAFMTGAKTGFGEGKVTPRALIEEIRNLADVARKEGPIALEGIQVSEPMLARGKQMVTDGIDPTNIRKSLELQRELELQRLVQGEKIFRALADSAPAFGMIGTLVGLVQMLSSMEDPSTIGPAMAVALLTTLYGALISNMICIPLADKLSSKLEAQETNLSLVIDGVLQIAERKSPDAVTDLLIVYLPEKARGGLVEAMA